MRRLLIALALLLAATGAHAQTQDTVAVQVPSVRAISTGGSPYRLVVDGIEQARTYAAPHTALAALDSAKLACPWCDVRIVQTLEWRADLRWVTYRTTQPRDSVPIPPPDTTTLPPPDTTIVLPPPDTIITDPGGPSLEGIYLLDGDHQQITVGSTAAVYPRVVVRDSLGAGVGGVEVTFAPVGTGSRFAGCAGTSGGSVPVPSGSLHRIAVTAGDGEAYCTIWQILEDGPQAATVSAGHYGMVDLRANMPLDPGELLDIVLTMSGVQGADFSMQVGETREWCAVALYERAVAPAPAPVSWTTSDAAAIQFGAQGPTGAHCIMVTALRETDDALGWGVPAGAVAWLDARRAR